MGGSPEIRSIIFSSREFAGRGAGRGNSAVVQGWICCRIPRSRKISEANSAQLASPSHVRWKVPQSFGRFRISRSPRATARALVGLPQPKIGI